MIKDSFELLTADVRDASDAPRGPTIYYRCRLCSGVIPSQPKDSVECECGNIFIDVDYIRLDVRDFNAFEVVQKKNN